MAMGLLEAFGWAEEYGRQALTFSELLFMASAKKTKGCKCQNNTLTESEIARVIELGKKCKKFGGNK